VGVVRGDEPGQSTSNQWVQSFDLPSLEENQMALEEDRLRPKLEGQALAVRRLHLS
jgi:hypothetical protein